jgi:hypothetical protein
VWGEGLVFQRLDCIYVVLIWFFFWLSDICEILYDIDMWFFFLVLCCNLCNIPWNFMLLIPST